MFTSLDLLSGEKEFRRQIIARNSLHEIWYFVLFFFFFFSSTSSMAQDQTIYVVNCIKYRIVSHRSLPTMNHLMISRNWFSVLLCVCVHCALCSISVPNCVVFAVVHKLCMNTLKFGHLRGFFRKWKFRCD